MNETIRASIPLPYKMDRLFFHPKASVRNKLARTQESKMHANTTPFRSLLVASFLLAGIASPFCEECQAARPSSRNVKSLRSQLKKPEKPAEPKKNDCDPAAVALPKIAETNAPLPPPVTVPPENMEQVSSTSIMDGDQEIIVQTVRGFTPSTKTIPASGPIVQFWGIALVDCPLFEQTGKRSSETLDGGSLIEQISALQSSRGEMAKIKIWNGTSWGGEYLVSTADLVRFQGGRDDVDAEGVEDLRTYYSLASQLEKRKVEVAQTAAGKNPHYDQLKALVTEFNANEEKVKRLTEQRDTTKGSRRTRLADELRRLEVQIQREKAQLKDVTAKFEAWKANHINDVTPDYAADPVIKSIQGQMATIKPRLASFGL